MQEYHQSNTKVKESEMCSARALFYGYIWATTLALGCPFWGTIKTATYHLAYHI